MRRSLVTLMSLLALAPTGVDAQPRATGAAPDAYALLESAGRAYGATSALCADFRQTLTVPLLGEERKGAGRLCTKKPDLFSMRFSEPKGDVVLADGKFFWLYTPSTDAKQVLKFPETQGPRGIDFYQEFLSTPRQKYKAVYKGRETIGGKTTDRIELTPLQQAPYKNADVWLDAQGSLLRQVQVREENGSVRTVTLDATDTQTAPPPGAFTFTPPAGTQVISR